MLITGSIFRLLVKYNKSTDAVGLTTQIFSFFLQLLGILLFLWEYEKGLAAVACRGFYLGIYGSAGPGNNIGFRAAGVVPAADHGTEPLGAVCDTKENQKAATP